MPYKDYFTISQVQISTLQLNSIHFKILCLRFQSPIVDFYIALLLSLRSMFLDPKHILRSDAVYHSSFKYLVRNYHFFCCRSYQLCVCLIWFGKLQGGRRFRWRGSFRCCARTLCGGVSLASLLSHGQYASHFLLKARRIISGSSQFNKRFQCSF